ncbi:MAG: ribosomal protein [Candidatus Berkelbacteria bacterium]|nr:ribosomal protein [Candidatus Berkelbacteria bacterium]
MKNTNLLKVNEKLVAKLGIKNIHALPKITKVVLNVGLGQSKTNPKFKDIVSESLKSIAGQKPAMRSAKKAIAGFKIRQGDIVGMIVTLRGNKMQDFLIKLANIVLPRMRDFRGLKLSGFDKNGNFSLGIREHIIFPEISHEKSEILHGLSVSINTTADNPQNGKILLESWGFPFEKAQDKPFEKQINTGMEKV